MSTTIPKEQTLLSKGPSKVYTPAYREIPVSFPEIVLPDELARKCEFGNVCRICANVATPFIPLYTYEGQKFDLVGKINKYLPIKVKDSDFLPRVICKQCASTLLSYHELVLSARIADFMLRRRLEPGGTKLRGPKPSESAGTEITKGEVNESLNWNVIEIKEDPKKSCEEYKQIGEQSYNGDEKAKAVLMKLNIEINENGKRFVSCNMCNKNVATSSWQRHLRAHYGERRYSCHTCGATFSDSGNLARHARALHARLRPHVCPESGCGRAFARSAHLQDHVRSHRDVRDYICHVCGKTSKSAAALRMHARTHDAPRRFHCMECGSQFKRKTELRAHVTIHTGERAHLCGCGRAFRLRSQLTTHARTHDGYVDAATDAPELPTERKCSFCPLTVPARMYNAHVVDVHSKVTFRCDECHSYLDKQDLLFHMKSHGFSTLRESLRAEYNNKKSFQKENVIPDAQVNLTSVQQPQEIVPKVEKVNTDPKPAEENPVTPEKPEVESKPPTKQDSDVDSTPSKQKRIHPKRRSDVKPPAAKRQRKNARASVAKRANEIDNRDDGNDDDDEVNTPETSPAGKAVKIKEERIDKSPKASRTCPICGKQYRAPSSYFYHMKYFHKRSREHECTVCNKKFGTKANLAQHVSIHTGAYDLECKECGKRFKSKPSLYIHEQSHGGPKRWACTQCGRSFRWRTHLARHVTRHAAERGHICGTCGRGFSVRCDLLRHARTHTADEFHCVTCGLKFAQKRYLQVHMVKKHPELPQASQVMTRS